MTPQELWQSQPEQEQIMSLERVRAEAQRWQRRIARRNAREYAAFAIVAVMFGRAAWTSPSDLVRVASVLIVAAAAFVSYYIHTRGRSRRDDVALAEHAVIDFHRAELERQRDLLQSVWLWYELPFIPGLVLFLIGTAQLHPERAGRAQWIGGAVALAVTIGTYALNRYAAARIQQRIDRLPRPD
jgi:hypothetical protein